DPIVEADRRGAILAIIRVGNKDDQIGGGQVVGMMGAAGSMGSGVPIGPQWGMPTSGTPIGLPGPPHIPMGVPAGLQKHVMHNHTQFHIPHPVEKMRMHIKETPGYAYPNPVSRVNVREHGHRVHGRPPQGPVNGGAYCPPE
ncbi:MAG: hypothetical protein N2C14_31655, partial [Planctomycetales bacterium]